MTRQRFSASSSPSSCIPFGMASSFGSPSVWRLRMLAAALLLAPGLLLLSLCLFLLLAPFQPQAEAIPLPRPRPLSLYEAPKDPGTPSIRENTLGSITETPPAATPLASPTPTKAFPSSIAQLSDNGLKSMRPTASSPLSSKPTSDLRALREEVSISRPPPRSASDIRHRHSPRTARSSGDRSRHRPQ